MLKHDDEVPAGTMILVAVSGGPDSVYLLHHLVEEREKRGWRLAVAHVNHGTRGADSDADEKFVRGLAESLNLPYFSERIAVDPDTPETPNEQWLRTRRLEILKSLAFRCRARVIAFGHHRDDLAETFLLQALRGSGPAGLEGLRRHRPVDGGRLIFFRPLLHLWKEQVEESLRDRNIAWRTDASNAGTRYRRNQVRHSVLPALSRVERGAAQNLANSAEFCGEVFAVYIEQVRAVVEKIELARSDTAVLFDVAQLRTDGSSEMLYGILREFCIWLTPTGSAPPLPRRDAVQNAKNRIARTAGNEADFDLGHGTKLSITNKYGIIYTGGDYVRAALSVAPGFSFILMPENARLPWNPSEDYFHGPPQVCDAYSCDFIASHSERIMQPEAYHTHGDRNLAYFDLDQIGKELHISPVPPGEKIKIGDGHAKSIRDCLQEAGVPPRLRSMVGGLYTGDQLLWIPGVRRAEGAWVSEASRLILEVERRPKDAFGEMVYR